MGNDLKQTINYLKLTSKGTVSTIARLNSIINSLNDKNNVIGVLKDSAVANNIKK